MASTSLVKTKALTRAGTTTACASRVQVEVEVVTVPKASAPPTSRNTEDKAATIQMTYLVAVIIIVTVAEDPNIKIRVVLTQTSIEVTTKNTTTAAVCLPTATPAHLELTIVLGRWTTAQVVSDPTRHLNDSTSEATTLCLKKVQTMRTANTSHSAKTWAAHCQ